MCKVFNCILVNIDVANFVATTTLSLLLIVATIIISWRQNKLQRNINNQQSQLQRNISERETKVNLYQYRMNCYLQIMEALDIAIYGKLEDYIGSFLSGGVESIKKLSDGRKMMLKALVVSETIFDDKIVTYIGELYNKYSALYIKSCDMLMVSDEEYKRRLILLEQKLNITLKDSKENVFVKFVNFSKTKEGTDFIQEILPEYEDCLVISNELNELFKPNNELFKLMYKCINMRTLNEI